MISKVQSIQLSEDYYKLRTKESPGKEDTKPGLRIGEKVCSAAGYASRRDSVFKHIFNGLSIFFKVISR